MPIQSLINLVNHDQVFTPADGDGLSSEVPLNELYNLSELELESIQAGRQQMRNLISTKKRRVVARRVRMKPCYAHWV